MTWDAWAAIGQLIGALGVVASLVFVGIQVRQSVRAAKATAFQGLVSSIIDVNMTHIENPALMDVIDRAARSETLTPSDHRLYVALILTAVRLAQSAYYQVELGLLDQSKLESVTYNLVRHLKTVPGRTVWSEIAQRSEPQFRQYIEDLVERAESYDALLNPKNRSEALAGA